MSTSCHSCCLFAVISVISLLPHAVSALEITNVTDNLGYAYNFTGSCAVKAWMSVAGCRKDFVEKIESKDNTGKCCLYKLMDRCANKGASRLCGDATDQVKEQYMKKYAKMINNIDCSSVELSSFTCFLIDWDNYLSCFVFLIIVLIMLIYVAKWFANQSLDWNDYQDL